MSTSADCGTYAGLQRHRRLGQEPCQPCRDAGAAQMRTYRKRASHRTRDRWWNRTRKAALEALAREYPARFLQLLDEERAATGWPADAIPGGTP